MKLLKPTKQSESNTQHKVREGMQFRLSGFVETKHSYSEIHVGEVLNTPIQDQKPRGKAIDKKCHCCQRI